MKIRGMLVGVIRVKRLLSPSLGKGPAVVAAALLMQACAVLPKDQASYAPTRPQPNIPPATQGAIYQAGHEMTLFQDFKARSVGDVITVMLVEQTSASKKAVTDTSKKQTAAMDTPTLLGAPLSFGLPGRAGKYSLGTDLSASRAFAGAGDSSQSNQLNGNVSVTVAEVLSNGNLVVRGEKRVTINQGDEYIRISGIVRPVDIAPDNTVLSNLVADAKISYTGTGELDNANSTGWLASFFNSKWWPF